MLVVFSVIMATLLSVSAIAYALAPEVKNVAPILEEMQDIEPMLFQEESVETEVEEEEINLEETEPTKTQDIYVEKYPEVPLYNQLDYGYTQYGNSTVKKSGCGIASYAMVLTYLLDREILPDELAAMYHRYKVDGGSAHGLFLDTWNEWGVTVENYYWEEAWLQGKLMKALENGQPVIANVHGDSAFTGTGHFIVLYGLNEQGRILVRDPNGENYMGQGFLVDGFENGFDPEYFSRISGNYFVYGAKDLDAIAALAKEQNLT